MLRSLALALIFALVPLTLQAATLQALGGLLTPNSGEQTITIIAMADEPIVGLDLYLSVSPFQGAPQITNVDLISGTIFQSNNNGQFYLPPYQPTGTDIVAITSAAAGDVGTSGIVAKITFDTTGMELRNHQLYFSIPGFGESIIFTQSGAEAAVGLPVTLSVPEPSSATLAVFAASMLPGLLTRGRQWAARRIS